MEVFGVEGTSRSLLTGGIVIGGKNQRKIEEVGEAETNIEEEVNNEIERATSQIETTEQSEDEESTDYDPQRVLTKTQPSEVLTEIEELLKNVSEQVDYLEVKLPNNLEKDKKFLEELFSIVKNAERVDDLLFIHIDGGTKEQTHLNVNNSLTGQLGGWWVYPKVMCTVNGNQYEPDVGAWQNTPTVAQRRKPIVNPCPAPDVWIEVIYNNQWDRTRNLQKIATLIPLIGANTEFVLIALPTGLSLHAANPNPGGAIVAANPVLANRPNRAPYVGYWNVGVAYAAAQWFKVRWNQQLALNCGAQLRFNGILDQLTA